MAQPSIDPDTLLCERVMSQPPRCLASVKTKPAPLIEDRDADVAVAFGLLSADAVETGALQGFDLRDYNADYKGPCEFISPLSVQWTGAAPAVLIFDSEVHGYHGELQCAAKLRGEGPSRAFACPHCSGRLFTVTVQFDYGDAEELWEEVPDTIQDHFSNFMVSGQCVACRQVTRVLDMDL